MNGYDLLAPFYDGLAYLVFGSAIKYSATNFDRLDRYNNLLIVGGGTGALLDQLEFVGFHGTVHYVEMSNGMIRRAKRRKVSFEVIFHQADVFSFQGTTTFDAIHMGFFLDQFQEDQLTRLINRLKYLTHDQSRWLVADFKPPDNRRKSWVISFMYFFFRKLTAIDNHSLPAIVKTMNDSGFKLIRRDSVHPMMESLEFMMDRD